MFVLIFISFIALTCCCYLVLASGSETTEEEDEEQIEYLRKWERERRKKEVKVKLQKGICIKVKLTKEMKRDFRECINTERETCTGCKLYLAKGMELCTNNEIYGRLRKK